MRSSARSNMALFASGACRPSWARRVGVAATLRWRDGPRERDTPALAGGRLPQWTFGGAPGNTAAKATNGHGRSCADPPMGSGGAAVTFPWARAVLRWTSNGYGRSCAGPMGMGRACGEPSNGYGRSCAGPSNGYGGPALTQWVRWRCGDLPIGTGGTTVEPCGLEHAYLFPCQRWVYVQMARIEAPLRA